MYSNEVCVFIPPMQMEMFKKQMTENVLNLIKYFELL